MSLLLFRRLSFLAVLWAVVDQGSAVISAQEKLAPIKYHNPGLVVDLGVGLWAWPMPMDYDRDGDIDLVVSCPDVPMSGTWLFENPGATSEGSPSRPVFQAPIRIADKASNVQVSYLDGEPIVMTPSTIYADFRKDQYSKPIKLKLPAKIDPQYNRYRANQWKLVDWENDGDLDIIVGIGVWDDYGWDDAWNEDGTWKNGPLHGFVYLVENLGKRSEERGEKRDGVDSLSQLSTLPNQPFAKPRKITTSDGEPIDVYGMPSPNFADFDGDGDLDLICGEFMDGFTWFKNDGTRENPSFRAGLPVAQKHAQMHTPDHAVKLPTPDVLDSRSFAFRLAMNLQMITPVAFDWNGDGAMDLIVGDEDGRVAVCQNLNAELRGTPSFREPFYFQQVADDVKFGALITPTSVDWDHDGDEDLVCGNTAGHIALIENLGGDQPQWERPTLFVEEYQTGGDIALSKILRHQAGPKGSIQGPCEAKWGYTTISVAKWFKKPEIGFEKDGKIVSLNNFHDVIVNDIWGRVTVHGANPILGADNNLHPRVSTAQPIQVDWPESPPKPAWVWWTPEENTLTTQWRTTPCALDWNGDGLTDLIMLDHEGYLAYYERQKTDDSNPPLMPPRRIFKIEGPCEFDSRHRPVGEKTDGLLRLNASHAGGSGRRKLHFVDWDGDGRLDLLVNSENVNWLRNVRTDDDGFVWFQDMGKMDDLRLAGHTTSPTTVDWDKNGIPDLLVGAEDGRLYYKRNPRTK
ncbi:MAG: VCBS repeat-containing protein [Planctomycetaceae bacterium]|nr:VCBS repeat-containing protein [Planctomycetaceae bacterium]